MHLRLLVAKIEMTLLIAAAGGCFRLEAVTLRLDSFSSWIRGWRSDLFEAFLVQQFLEDNLNSSFRWNGF
ncbi:hypothetical protein V6N13_050411 [Hibiscus sabdariffa]|uniref:Secreted protein n=1 Tax=Hibiscus sabdariffa TaxID=183260 RepID=A0ABR2AX78_9ROSI